MNWTRLTAQPGTRAHHGELPRRHQRHRQHKLPHLSRRARRAADHGRPLRAHRRCQGQRPRALAGPLQRDCRAVCSNAAPTFANRIDNAALEVGNGNSAILQGSYNLTLSAAPAADNGTLLYAGTVDLYRCIITAGSSTCALRNTTNALDDCNAPAMVAPAQHAVVTIAQASGTPIVFLGNDGGLWRSLDGVAETGSVCAATDKTHFDNLNAAIGTGGSLARSSASRSIQPTPTRCSQDSVPMAL